MPGSGASELCRNVVTGSRLLLGLHLRRLGAMPLASCPAVFTSIRR